MIPELCNNLMLAINQLTSHTFPQVMPEGMNADAVSADAHAIRYHATTLVDHLKGLAPKELKKLQDDTTRGRAELKKLERDIETMKKEYVDVSNNLAVENSKLDRARADLAKRQAVA